MTRPRKQRTTFHPPTQRMRHGLTPDQIAFILRRQDGKCLLCGAEITLATLVIDHDHLLAQLHGHPVDTGCRKCVRGLLDSRCNTALGAFRDDPDLLERAAHYIRLARGQA